jgi:hypothetical protein
LVNLSPKLLDLSGVELRSGFRTFVIASHIVLDYGERFTIGTDGLRYRNGDLWQVLSTPESGFNLVNASGNLEVRSSTGVLIDSVIWGSGQAFTVKSGKSAERSDVFAPGVAGNFQDATAAFGAGDLGTPGALNSPETSTFGMGLVATNAYHDDVLELHMLAQAHPSQFYGLGISTSATTGLDALGLHLPVDPTPTFFAVLDLPGAFGALDVQGQGQVAWPIGGDPGFIGVNLFACFITFDGALSGLGVSNLATITIE